MPQIEFIKNKHLQECMLLSDKLLGKNYHSSDYFEIAISNNQGLAIINNGKVIGFLIFTTTSPNNSFKMYRLHLTESVGHIGSVCVSESFQKQGIASQLVEKAVLILQKKYNSIFTLAWEYNGIVNLKNVLLKNGFSELKRIDLIWKNECENNEFYCPVKEEDKCICSGIVFELRPN